MTTILKCSILSILRLEKLLLQPDGQEAPKSNVRYCLRRRKFTIHNPPPSTDENSSACSKSSPQLKRKRRLTGLSWALLTVAVVLLGFAIKWAFPYPLHASCLVKWDFREPCVFVYQRFRSQIIKWSDYKYCGVNCFYKLRDLEAYENDTVRATRIRSPSNLIDDIDIVFIHLTNRSCTALAESSSRGWYKLFDDGRNYCNLRDLVAGAGYDERHFLEFTSNLICTQYDMAYCD